MKILVSDAFDESLPGKLSKFGDVFFDKDRLAEADVVLIRSKTKCTPEYLDQAKNLKLIIRGGVGLDNVDLCYAKSKGIIVRNTPEASSIAVAELAMAFILGIPANIIPGHIAMTHGKWAKKQLKRIEIHGKTLGLIGIGRIAQQVAIRAQACGMRIIAYDKYVETSDVAEMVSFPELLSSSDFISLHVPQTQETIGMINADTIRQMKDGVVLINTGRARCIVEKDVAEALETGKIKAYGTDVWNSDPPDWNNCPILKAPNVFMTPHIGASTQENLLRIGKIIERIIEEFNGRTAQ